MIELEGGHAVQFLSVQVTLIMAYRAKKLWQIIKATARDVYGTSHTAFLRIVPFDQDLHGHGAEKAAREEGTNKKIGCLHCRIGSSLLRSVWNRGVTRESFQRTTCNLADGFCYSLLFNSWNPKVEATAAARGLGGMARYYLYSLSVWIKNTPL